MYRSLTHRVFLLLPIFSTGQLIGCVGVHITYSDVKKFLQGHKINNESAVCIVRLRDDTVFGDTLPVNALGLETFPVVVNKTDFISAENYLKLKRSAFDMNKNWTAANFVHEIVVGENAVYTANVLPFPPDEYNPKYEPEFLIIHAISNDVFNVTEEVKNKIDSEVRQMCLLAFVIGTCGVTLVFFIVWYVSRALTEPLLWIERLAWGIVNPADKRADKSFLDTDEPKSSTKCVPNTEISKLVSEFRAMITGFSGDGASKVAHSDEHEIKNEMTWQSDYQQALKDARAQKKPIFLEFRCEA